jgi:hypothetical protein
MFVWKIIIEMNKKQCNYFSTIRLPFAGVKTSQRIDENQITDMRKVDRTEELFH